MAEILYTTAGIVLCTLGAACMVAETVAAAQAAGRDRAAFWRAFTRCGVAGVTFLVGIALMVER